MHEAGSRQPRGRRVPNVPRNGLTALFLLTLIAPGCSEHGRAGRSPADILWGGGQPDEPPQMLNESLPFQYPVTQYLNRMQGNVTLRLFVDSAGLIVTDSTRIERPSGLAAFDSAALAGVAALRFRPARRRGTPIAVAMLFPVHFRHPEVQAAPVDSLRPDSR